MKSEARFEKKLIAEFKKRGFFASHFEGYGFDGWPDILAVRGDRFILVECKHKTDKLRPTQYHFIEHILNPVDSHAYVAVDHGNYCAIGKKFKNEEWMFWPVGGIEEVVESIIKSEKMDA